MKYMKIIRISGILFAILLLCSTAARAEDVNDSGNAIPGKTASDEEGGGLHDADPTRNMEKKSDDTLIRTQEDKESSRNGSGIHREKNAQRTRFSFIDSTRKEYVALFFGYGGYFPVADYGKAYHPGHLVSFTAGIYYINFLGLSPEIHVRYAAMNYREDPIRYRAGLCQVQAYPAIVYRYPIKLPRNTLTVYGRIWDGLSRIHYESRDPYFPAVTRNITEHLNVFGLSAGCYYDVWRGFLVGVDFSYSIVSTARKPLQAVSFMVNAGWRIL